MSWKTATANSSMAKTAGAIMLDAMLSSAHRLNLTSACPMTHQSTDFTVEGTCMLHDFFAQCRAMVYYGSAPLSNNDKHGCRIDNTQAVQAAECNRSIRTASRQKH